MQVASNSSVPVGSLLWQSPRGGWVLTAIAKVTFELAVGEARVAEHHEPLWETDVHHDDDEGRCIRGASDLVPLKPRADVVLVGSVYAPGGEPARSVVARLIVGEVDKSIEVCSDRVFLQDGTLREGAPFTRMPLVYERAAGGPDTSNPVGLRNDVRDRLGRTVVPNLQPPSTHVASPVDTVLPIGFGPIAASWPARRAKLGRYTDLAVGPLAERVIPDDLDRTYFNSAPLDQQASILRADERIVLENLHPELPRFVANLPGLRPRVTLEARGAQQSLTPKCDTLWIDTDRLLCTMTWRVHANIERPDEAGRVVIAFDDGLAVASHTFDDPETPPPSSRPKKAPARAPATSSGDDERLRSAGRRAATLPFIRAEGLGDGDRGSALPGLPFASSSANSLPRPPMTTPPQPSGQQTLPPALPQPPPMTTPPQPSGQQTLPPQPPPPPPIIPAPAPSNPARKPAMTAEVPVWTEPVAKPAVAPPPPPPAPSAPAWNANSPWAGSGGPRAEVKPGKSIGENAVEAAGVAPTTQEDASKGVLAVSNTAAGPSKAPWSRGADGASAAEPAAKAEAATGHALDSRVALHLVWYAPDAVARICRVPAFRAALDARDREAADAAEEDVEIDERSPAHDPVEVEDRRDVFDILARAEARDVGELAGALAGAVRKDRRFVPPLVLFGGDLAFPFDEREVLKAIVGIVTPLSPGDEPLKAAIKDAREFIASPDFAPAAVVESYGARIKEALEKSRRVGLVDLDASVERALVERRAYQRRGVLGMTALRAQLHALTGTTSKPAPAYLPEDVAKKLPLFARFRARIVGEAIFQEDPAEQHQGAVRVLALARVVNVGAAAAGPDKR
ncbi:MAG TPA: DUF2169 domain-containing protein [Byssovorax sp.]